MPLYIDLAHAQDVEGFFDLVIDATARDLATSDGLESVLLVSLFSDRRAAADEVSDPLERRGWLGNAAAEVPGDNHGSGLWLYEQRRLTQAVVNGVRSEAEQALAWMREQNMARDVSATPQTDPAKRLLTLNIEITDPQGGTSNRAYLLADATRTGAFVTL